MPLMGARVVPVAPASVPGAGLVGLVATLDPAVPPVSSSRSSRTVTVAAVSSTATTLSRAVTRRAPRPGRRGPAIGPPPCVHGPGGSGVGGGCAGVGAAAGLCVQPSDWVADNGHLMACAGPAADVRERRNGAGSTVLERRTAPDLVAPTLPPGT